MIRNISHITHRISNIPHLTSLIICFLLLGGCAKPPEDMVLVPAGEFIMGSNEVDTEVKALQYGDKRPWYANERPERRVNLKKFYIDRFEVTNARIWNL